MGGHDYESHGAKSVTKKQANRINKIDPNYAYSEWYYVVDEVTGAKKKLRKKIKQNQRRKRSK